VQDIQTGIDALVGTVSNLKERLKEGEIFEEKQQFAEALRDLSRRLEAIAGSFA
jgi:soluble cytochrome b562